MKLRNLSAALLALTLLLTACGSAQGEITTSQTSETTATQAAETTASLETSQTVPPAEVKPIRAILNYSYNAFAASSAWYGYNFYYYTPTQVVTGQTMKTPIDVGDPLNTPDVVNRTAQESGTGFEALCDDLWAMRFDLLPATVEVDYERFIHDGSNQYIVIYFEDGTTFTSEGYCATEYSEQFNAVWDWLQLFRASIGMP